MKTSEQRTEKDFHILMPIVKELKFFLQKQIVGQDLHEVCHLVKHEYMRAGDHVFKYGDFGDKFYVILKGQVSIRIPDPKNKNKDITTLAVPT